MVDGPSTVTVPRTRAARQALVASLLAAAPVRSQAELVSLLAREGCPVTQATLSRDLDELRAHKADGIYRLPAGDAAAPSAATAQWPWPRSSAEAPAEGWTRLARRCTELLLSAEVAGTLVVAQTPPGGAHLLASALDRAVLSEVVGSVAGDDTIFLACRSTRDAHAVARRLVESTGRAPRAEERRATPWAAIARAATAPAGGPAEAGAAGAAVLNPPEPPPTTKEQRL